MCDGCAGWCRQSHKEGSRCQSKGIKFRDCFLMCLNYIETFWFDARYPQQATVACENNYNQRKKLDLFLDLNYFSFSKANSNPKQLNLTPNPQSYSSDFSAICRIIFWAFAHGVKSENSKVRHFIWHRHLRKCDKNKSKVLADKSKEK